MPDRDRSLDTLLDLDGEVLVIGEAQRHVVRFRAKSVEPTADRPHGLGYSLTLHGEDGSRLVGSITRIRYGGRAARAGG